jgi:2'-5' RNA ligase
MPRQRLGVVLLIPPPIGTEIDALRKAVGDDDIGRIAPHITLVPPVNVRDDDIEAAVAVVHAAAQGTAPLRLTLGPVTTFAPESPTIHLAVGGDVDALTGLRDAVFTAPLERSLTHPFVPHVTLVEESPRIDDAVRALADYRAEVVIDRVHLMRESRDDEHHRIWRPMADAPLGDRRAVVGRGGLELELTPAGQLPVDAQRWTDEQWSAFDVERYGEVRRPNEPIGIVARRDGEIVATAHGDVRRATGEAYLEGLMVRGDVRSEGIGVHVVAAFASLAADRGATYLTLRTQAEGRSRAFYERLGFTVWYRMTAWRNGDDFVQMRRDL